MIPSESLPEIVSPAVGIIPNLKTWQYGGAQQMESVFKTAIQYLLDSRQNVYLLAHSKEDLALCKQFKATFNAEDSVKLISEEYDCIMLQKILGRLDFVLASRYHSIVHAFKETVPVIAIGWAEKYAELLDLFGQSKYLFDVREKIDSTQILSAIANMNTHLKANRDKINTQLGVIQKNNIFDRINWPLLFNTSEDK
jgi:colanic acid/amylovoran biosynthesis protein